MEEAKQELETIFGNVVGKANNYQVVPDKANHGKRIIKTAKLRAYERNFTEQCKVYRNRMIDYPFALNIAVYFRSSVHDIDNAIKTILDCLQYVGAITDDNLCYKLNAEKRISKDQPRITFSITPFSVYLGGLFHQKSF